MTDLADAPPDRPIVISRSTSLEPPWDVAWSVGNLRQCDLHHLREALDHYFRTVAAEPLPDRAAMAAHARTLTRLSTLIDALEPVPMPGPSPDDCPAPDEPVADHRGIGRNGIERYVAEWTARAQAPS